MSMSEKIMKYQRIYKVFPLIYLCVIGTSIIALVLGIVTGITGIYIPAVVMSISFIITILVLRRREWIVVLLLVTSLYIDWYLGHLIITPMLTCLLLIVFFLTRSSEASWEKPRALWLWAMYLILAIPPALQGALTRYDAAFYYPNIVFGALLMFWLGTVLAGDVKRLRRFFQLFAGMGTLLALITFIQAQTGTLLFGTSRFDISLASDANYNIFQGSSVYRLGAFFVNPDWNGAFFAALLCIPLGLSLACSHLWGKLFYLAETLIILPALLFTYSIGSWISAGVGLLAFVMLLRRMRYRVGIILFAALGIVTLLTCFPSQITLLFQHGSDPTTLILRNGAWITALHVIQAHPFSGIGLGLQAYMQRAEPYRVPEQYKLLAHPHNSYLELGAMAGLPVLACFSGLILYALWRALRNWVQVDIKQSTLLSGGIAAIIALSMNSLSVNVWTLPPLAACGWLILGSISSPLLTKKFAQRQRESISPDDQKQHHHLLFKTGNGLNI